MIRSQHHKKRLAAIIAVSSVAAMASTAAWSQQSANATLEEIVVTAQKREQNLQKVPVSVTAFSGLELESKGITSTIDLEKSVPNTQFRASRATNSTLTAYIRGVGQQDPV